MPYFQVPSGNRKGGYESAARRVSETEIFWENPVPSVVSYSLRSVCKPWFAASVGWTALGFAAVPTEYRPSREQAVPKEAHGIRTLGPGCGASGCVGQLPA